jgi:hypothetical protein
MEESIFLLNNTNKNETTVFFINNISDDAIMHPEGIF